MNIYKVNYDGLWMGGISIVIAETEEEAINLARHDRATVRFNDVTVELLEVDLARPTVIYNYNGDY